MANAVIKNGSNIPINALAGTVPDVSVALLDWFQYLTFGLITKTIVAFQLNETITNISFWGFVQPYKGRTLKIRSSGERDWDYLECFAQSAPGNAMLSLNADDIILYAGTRYRVMLKEDFPLYGYVRFELTENYTGDVPTP
jgi:hypothetical protein